MKSLVASETLLAYPDHNILFHIETDASDLQLGAVIKQNGKPVAFYTRKLTPAQHNYSTIEKELLSIVETFCEFHLMLLGSNIHVYTDHKNLTHKLSQYVTQHVLCWRLLLEEYNPTFHYLKGPDNVPADALERLPSSIANTLSSTNSSTPAKLPPSPPLEKVTEALRYIDNLELAECLAEMPLSERQPAGPHNDVVPDLYNDCLLFHHDFDPQKNLPFHFATMHHYQQCGPWLQDASKHDHHFYTQCLGSLDIICYCALSAAPSSDWKIALPSNMLGPLIHWYHKTLTHAPVMDRLEALIKRAFHHPKICDACHSILSNCPISPMVHTTYKPYGHLAPCNAPILPWSEVHVDCIGPWKVSLPNNKTIQFYALTCIDPVTNLIEILRFHGPPIAEKMKQLFENHWLARYPHPEKIVHDYGPEFLGHDFQFPLNYAGIKPTNISAHTPTSNSIIGASHKIIGQVLCTLLLLHNPTDPTQADYILDEAVATAMQALRCTPNTSLGNYSPGTLVFQHNMFLNFPLITDIVMLTQQRQAQIDCRLIKINSRRVVHDYAVGDKVYYCNFDRNKFEAVCFGPYEVLHVHTNNRVVKTNVKRN